MKKLNQCIEALLNIGVRAEFIDLAAIGRLIGLPDDVFGNVYKARPVADGNIRVSGRVIQPYIHIPRI